MIERRSVDLLRATRLSIAAFALLTACHSSSSAPCPSISGGSGACYCTYSGGAYDCQGTKYPPCTNLDASTCLADAGQCLACQAPTATLYQCVRPVAADGAVGGAFVWTYAPTGDLTCQGP